MSIAFSNIPAIIIGTRISPDGTGFSQIFPEKPVGIWLYQQEFAFLSAGC